MMFLSVLLLSIAFAAPINAFDKRNVAPRDLEDEIREQLEEVKATVRGQIFASFNTLDNYVREVYYARDNSLSTARVDIELEYETISSQMILLKDLAAAAGHDVEICLATNEPLLAELPQVIIDSLMECLAFANMEMTTILNDARYKIDILMGEVNVFDFELDFCAGDFLCMAPLVTEIELALIEVPEKIELEVQAAEGLFADLQVLVEACTRDKVAQFSAEGGIILNQVTSCVSEIIS